MEPKKQKFEIQKLPNEIPKMQHKGVKCPYCIRKIKRRKLKMHDKKCPLIDLCKDPHRLKITSARLRENRVECSKCLQRFWGFVKLHKCKYSKHQRLCVFCDKYKKNPYRHNDRCFYKKIMLKKKFYIVNYHWRDREIFTRRTIDKLFEKQPEKSKKIPDSHEWTPELIKVAQIYPGATLEDSQRLLNYWKDPYRNPQTLIRPEPLILNPATTIETKRKPNLNALQGCLDIDQFIEKQIKNSTAYIAATQENELSEFKAHRLYLNCLLKNELVNNFGLSYFYFKQDYQDTELKSLFEIKKELNYMEGVDDLPKDAPEIKERLDIVHSETKEATNIEINSNQEINSDEDYIICPATPKRQDPNSFSYPEPPETNIDENKIEELPLKNNKVQKLPTVDKKIQEHIKISKLTKKSNRSDSIVSIYKECFRNFNSVMLKWVHICNTYYLEVDNQIIGCFTYQKLKKNGIQVLNILLFCIRLNFQRWGFGRMLMEKAITMCDRIILWADAGSVGFYSKFDFDFVIDDDKWIPYEDQSYLMMRGYTTGDKDRIGINWDGMRNHLRSVNKMLKRDLLYNIRINKL